MVTPSCIVSVALAAVFLAANVALAATPPYKCFTFSGGGIGTERSIDKSGIRQQRKNGGSCPGTSCAAIEPMGNIVREVGDPYEAYCLFDSTSVNVSDVSFIHIGKNDQDRYPIPHTVVNDSAIRVEVSHNASAKYQLWCAEGGSQHLCSRSVKIGYPPQDVQNFSCLSKNWEDLNCTWTVPENPVAVQYTLTYVIPGFKEQSDCPTSHTYPNSCFWPNNIFTLNVKDKWVMQFNASNRIRRDGILFNHTVSTYESVLPNPVEKLAAHVDGPRNVTLTWILPHPIDTFAKIVCEAAYRERHDGDIPEEVPWKVVDQWKEEPDRWNREEVFNKTINDLHPYIQYDFRVRIHTGFGEIRPHMWSAAEILTKRTSPTYPAMAPKTTLGTFEVEETQSFRDIYINWQKVDPLFYNGPNFTYRIDVYEDKTNRLIEMNPPDLDIKEALAKISNLQKDVAYRFEIIPVNDEGPPENENVKAVVIVPEKNDVLKQPSFFRVIAYADSSKTTYSMRWHVDEDEFRDVASVTLFWCKKDKYEERCLNKLEWEIVHNPNLNVKNITGLEETSLYLFGISVNSQSSSSGIKWITCIASYGNRPPPLGQFSASEVSTTEVQLEWSLDCKARAGEPIGFNISYCTVAEKLENCPPGADLKYEVIMNEAALDHKIKNLHPFTHYIFNVAVLTQIGLSKWSKSVYVQTKPDRPSGPPEAFTVVQNGQNWTLLSWKLPAAEKRNGKVVKYEVMWEHQERIIPANTSSEFTRYNVTNLEPYTNYEFRVVACTTIKPEDVSCGSDPAKVDHRTKIGAPYKIDDISQDDKYMKWDHECSNGPTCFYQLQYEVNGSYPIHDTKPNAAAINIKDLNITCTEKKSSLKVRLRAVTVDEEHQKLYGPWKEESVTCYLPATPWWVILVIAAVSIVIIVVLIAVGQYVYGKFKQFLIQLERKPVLPSGLKDVEPRPVRNNSFYNKFWPPLSRDEGGEEKPKTTYPAMSEGQESEDLISSGGDRGGRNLSGDSGTSETDPGDSSGCSTGGESDSSSASDGVHRSSDSGTVQEEPGFSIDGNKCFGSGSLRQRPHGTPYVRQGLADRMNGEGYVSASSVPNLAVGMADGSIPLQTCMPNGVLGTLPEMNLRARTSTGYISMPDADADAISLDVLSNLTLAHEGRQTGFPAYSRHNFPYKKTPPDLSPYTKSGSLPWLNTGYVAVAQAEGGRREAVPQARGYVAVSDAMGVMKRQPSLPSLTTGVSKSISTPQGDLPPAAYCRVGSRSSPGPPTGSSPGYVGITQGIPLHAPPNSLTTTSPTNKSPYVTCAIAESLVSPNSTPEKGSGGYVSVGDIPGSRWAHPVMLPGTGEESREVASAPVEGSRGRPTIPTRPSTSDATVSHNQGGSRWPPLAPSLSKQSSGYVSQETLTFHDPVLMSPKRLCVQSREPHSVVLSANHKASMV